MNFLYQTLPLGVIELASKDVLIIIGLIAFFFLFVGSKIAFGFMRTMGRYSQQYGMMGHIMPPMMGGGGQQQERPKKGGSMMSTIAFVAALFLTWQIVLQGNSNKRSVNYNHQDTNTQQPILRFGTPDSKSLDTSKRTPKESRRNVHPGATRPKGNSNKEFYNTSPSQLQQANERTRPKEENYPEVFAEVNTPDQIRSTANITLQIACGSVLDFVVDKAQQVKTVFPNCPIYIFDDTSAGCIKILVGSFTSESEALQFKQRNASKLDKKGILVGLDNIPEGSLVELAR